MAKNYKELTDFELVKLIEEGDIKAFEEIFERYRMFVKNIARKFSNENNRVEEILQNTFLKVFMKIDQFKKNAKFSSWLYTICKNEGRMFLREREKYRKFKNIEDRMDHFERKENKSIDEKVELKDLKKTVKKAISELPKHYQQVLKKAAFEGKKYQEIAEELDLTTPQVKSRLYRARQKLKEMLAKHIKYTSY
ncbi:MAG: RNA polymerase sigma factor [Candidatus Mcinerneyibacterium aminivorans]|jgi:RNA polymerase sigma-70 factor (ECF subfamily)|uniref:RNA polymerase sigma factor n=1 Tax=Candidatus Mcinerneyibacterium aminivorans TaxID=2703815 RepID=A0A5D0MEP0_9BACT|nr:MAG: RNA polymerase sigma factor [Candidatus Mcinerneyibacterium aminivorans]